MGPQSQITISQSSFFNWGGTTVLRSLCARVFDFAPAPASLFKGNRLKILLALIFGVLLGAAGLWLYVNQGNARVQSTANQVSNAVSSAGTALHDELQSLHLRPEDVKDELARTGEIVRRQAQQTGKAIADATADARITTAIKGKLVAARDLPALSISVNTTGGIVTLSGSVPAVEDISKAMLVAMQTDGVREVISTLQVNKSR
jgi:hypothetical protein